MQISEENFQKKNDAENCTEKSTGNFLQKIYLRKFLKKN